MSHVSFCYKPAPRPKIEIAPSHGLNEVDDQHLLTATVQVDPDQSGTFQPVAGASVTFELLSGVGTLNPTAATSDANGIAQTTLTSGKVGTDSVRACASFTFEGEPLEACTDGVAPNSGPATKFWVDAQIAIAPDDRNGITEDHTFTATFTAVPGDLPRPSVVFNSLSIAITPPAGFVAGTDFTETTTCSAPSVSGNVATCTTTINSKKAGTFVANATGSVTLSATLADGNLHSEQVDRTTDGKGTSSANERQNSGPATKVYVAGSLAWLKHDDQSRLLTGATFEACRVLDRFGAPVSDPCVTVVDNAAPDQDPTGGRFVLSGLVLGTWTIRETAAPPGGFLFDPDFVQQAVLTLDAPDGSAAFPFVNVPPLPGISINVQNVQIATVNGSATFTGGAVHSVTGSFDIVAHDVGVTVSEIDFTVKKGNTAFWTGTCETVPEPFFNVETGEVRSVTYDCTGITGSPDFVKSDDVTVEVRVTLATGPTFSNSGFYRVQ